MDIVEAARSFLKVPFRHQGRNRLGLDCLGLVIMSAELAGVELEDLKGYARVPDSDRLRSECDRQLKKVNMSDMRNGDLLLMVFRTEPQHIAIKTDIGIIHSHKADGGVVEHRLDDVWLKRIKGVYRL